MACIPRGVAAGVAVEDGVLACEDGGGCEAAREDAGDASSRPAMPAQEDFRCAAATFRFQDSNFPEYGLRRRRPCFLSNPLWDFPTPNYRRLSIQTHFLN